MAKEHRNIKVHIITPEDISHCLQDMAEMGMLDVPLAVNDKEYVKSMICLYFNSLNRFQVMIGQPPYVLPDKDDSKDEDDE